MHPLHITTPNWQPKTLAEKLLRAPQEAQGNFIEALAEDFERQTAKDYNAGKKRLALATQNATAHLYEAARQLPPALENQLEGYDIPLLAQETGNLRYDKLLEFIHPYAQQAPMAIRNNLKDATTLFTQAWERYTPLWWKKSYAPETITNKYY